MTAIVLAVFIENGRILMVRRADHKKQYPGHWELIGGHIEADEAVEVALVREAEEEVGLAPTTFRHVGISRTARVKPTTIYSPSPIG